MKIPIAIVQKLNVRLIVYLDDILLMASTVEEILMARDTLIFLFQNLGFLINVKKSQFYPVQHLEFLGVNVNSIKMELTLPSENINKIIANARTS